MALSKSDFKLYLTSVEPALEQTSYSQSIGGYGAFVVTDLTKSLLYPETTLLSNSVGLFQRDLVLSSYSTIADKFYISINDEIIETENIGSTSVKVRERAINNVNRMHLVGDVVKGLSTSSLFNNNFNRFFKQYRCLALRNNNAVDTAYNLQIYLKHVSQNPGCKIRIAVEIPESDYISGTITSTGNNKKQVVASALSNSYEDNHFSNALLRFTTGNNINQERVISSFDSSSGTIILSSDVPFTPDVGETFEIEPCPSQRVASGIISPSFNTDRVSKLLMPTVDNPILFNINNNRDHDNEFRSKDVIYIWIERTLDRTSKNFDVNNACISIRYSES